MSENKEMIESCEPAKVTTEQQKKSTKKLPLNASANVKKKPFKRSEFGTTWFYGAEGPKAAMLEHKLISNYKCAVAKVDHIHNWHSFACYPDWETCWNNISKIPSEKRHIFEMVLADCKPYGDIDYTEELPEGMTPEEARQKLTTAIVEIFKTEYRITIGLNDVVWTISPNSTKLHSWHFTVSTAQAQRQPVFRSPREAKHLGECIKRYAKDLGHGVDFTVYYSDSEMRLVGSSKQSNPTSILIPVDPNRPMRDMVITWFRKSQRKVVIDIPKRIESLLRKQMERPKKTVAEANAATKGVEQASELPGVEKKLHPASDRLITQTMDLMKNLHPTAFQDFSHNQHNILDPLVGIKINYTDRQEPCYSGEKHDGLQRLWAWVAGDEVWCKCFSTKCTQAHHLGTISDGEGNRFDNVSVKINRRFISEEPTEPDAMSALLPQWLNGDFKALGLKSVMATGKTTFLETLIKENFVGKSILFVTYRQSLAIELASRFPDFENYMQVSGCLADRKEHPRVVLQLDSFDRLSEVGEIAEFDLIILDEAVSLLNHFSSLTISNPRNLLLTLGETLKSAGHIITMDALWENEVYDFLRMNDITQRVVINEWKPQPRTFRFSNDEKAWTKSIANDLEKGHNVAVATMSAEAAYRLRDNMLKLLPEVELEIILHTSRSDDEMKQYLRNVNGFWKTGRLVIYTPTIEAGVDFNQKHFHKLYVYCCLRSTTPLGGVQMTGRVRQLKSSKIECCVTENMIGQVQPKVTTAEMLSEIRWLYKHSRRLSSSDEEPKITNIPLTFQYVEGGKKVLLPEDSPMLHVIAANRARYVNGQSRFIAEMIQLLNEQGHKAYVVRAEPIKKKDDEEAILSMTKQKLLTMAPVKKIEWEKIKLRIDTAKASEEDKWQDLVNAYCAAWGIKLVTSDFLEKHGIECGSSAVKHVLELLAPSHSTDPVGNYERDTFPVMNGVLKEVTEALGLKSIVDYETVFVLEDRWDALMKTSLFTERKNTYKLFNRRPPVVEGAYTIRQITDTLKSVFKACGICYATKGRDQTKNARHCYTLTKESCEESLELAFMRYKSRERVKGYEEPLVFKNFKPKVYKHLIDPSVI